MQNTLPLAPSHPVKSLIGLARQIALPHEFAPERFPSFPALERTAVMGFCQPSTLNLTAAVETKVMLSRQACFPLWADQDPGVLFSYQCAYQTQNVNSRVNDSGSAEVMGMFDWTVGNALATAEVAGITGTSRLGDYPVLAVDAHQVPFIWVPVGTSVAVCVARPNATGISGMRVMFEAWTSPGQCDNFVTSVNIGNTFFSAGTAVGGAGQWIRPVSVSYNNDATATFTGQIGVALVVLNASAIISPSTTVMPTVTGTRIPGRHFLPMTYPAEYTNSRLPWFAARTTAAAMLGSNVSAVVTKAGTILGGRISPNVVSPFNVTSSYINTLHPAEKAWLPCETGVYTYCPPSTDLSNFWDYTAHATNPSAVSPPLYRLDNDALVNVMYITAGATAEQLAITLDWHLEFRTSSALFQIGLCTIPLEVLHQAQLSLTSAGFFFENPEHKNVLNKVMNAVKRYGPKIATIASAALPQYAAVFRGAKMLLPKANAMKMKPTNAVDTGIVTAPKGKNNRKGKGNNQIRKQGKRGKK